MQRQYVRQQLRRHRKLITLGLAAALMAAAWLVPREPRTAYVWLMTAAAVVAGIPVAQQAWGNARLRQFSIPLLVTVAATGAVIIGEVWEAAAVTFLFVLGGYREDLTLARTRAALRSLIDMRPRTARVKHGDSWTEVPADAVQAGQAVVILPGDRVPVDGHVTAGRAAIDTAALTGEPLPAEVGPGDKVLSGSVSQGGHLEVVAERVGVFTRDVHLALTFLVIGCPGALVVAAPVANVAGLGRAARAGILIKGGERLERIGKIDVIAFDKTGTLTHGKPTVSAVVPFPGHTEAEVLALAAAAEQRSEHHLATAILNHAAAAGVKAKAADGWRLEPGMGAVAETADGLILVGNRRLLAAHGLSLTAEHEAAIEAREDHGESVAIVAVRDTPVGVIGISDQIRAEARTLVPALRRAGVRRTVMLTGDNPAAAKRVAAQLGLDAVEAGLSPADKAAAIRQLQAEGHVVAMIGDGINDAPALATADVSIAMGGAGTEAALEAADITLMSDRIERVPEAIRLSRRITEIVRQNVGIAVATVALLLAGVIARRVHLAGGMLVHEASVMIVIVNGMRLLRRQCITRSGRISPASAVAAPGLTRWVTLALYRSQPRYIQSYEADRPDRLRKRPQTSPHRDQKRNLDRGSDRPRRRDP